MPLPPFEPSGDLPEGLYQADVAEFFAWFAVACLSVSVWQRGFYRHLS